MNRRERVLLIVIGSMAGLWVFYNAFNYLFISPIRESDDKIAKLEAEIRRLDGVLRSKDNLVKRWTSLVHHTLSYDAAEASNRFAQDIKNVAKRHRVTIGSVSSATGMKIGNKTGIDSVAYRVVADGRFAETLGFLVDLYKSPYLSQVTRLSYSPLLQKGRPRDEVRLEVTVETPVAPRGDKKKMPEVAELSPLPLEADPPPGPSRPHPKSLQDFPLLADRIIFRPYVPPPTNVIVVDNQDWKTVGLRIVFLWDGKLSEEVVDTLPSKTQRQYVRKGDVVEVNGAYADGKTFGPERFDFSAKKDFGYVVAVHSDRPPPTVVDLAVDNLSGDVVDVEVTVTLKDDAVRTKPTMRIKAGTKQDIDTYECKSVQVAATYASGKKASIATYQPMAGKQVYTVPLEPTEVAVQPVNDPPPDGALSVSGLVTYQEVQEMIGSAGVQRKIFRAGQEGIVDGGTLLAVHPLGGVVKMPSGNYYLYPLGRRFADRVKLEAAKENDLAAAVDAWSRR